MRIIHFLKINRNVYSVKKVVFLKAFQRHFLIILRLQKKIIFKNKICWIWIKFTNCKKLDWDIKQKIINNKEYRVKYWGNNKLRTKGVNQPKCLNWILSILFLFKIRIIHIMVHTLFLRAWHRVLWAENKLLNPISQLKKKLINLN